MLGTAGFGLSKTCTIAEPTPKSTKCLVHIRTMLAVLVLIHIGIFIIAVVAAVNIAKTVTYYQAYLAGPLSGPSVAITVANGMTTVEAVKNITTLASALAAAGASSMGFDDAGRPENVTAVPARRSMIEVFDENSATVQDALAKLLNTLSDKIKEFDAAAPGHFLQWVMASNPGPYIRQMMGSARYGIASLGTVLGALGSPVDATIAGPDLID